MSEGFNKGYALLIGVGECSYKRGSLTITGKDTQAIYKALIDPDLCAYPDDKEAGDFAIALLRGGKGLPDKGWEEVRPEATQKINKIADSITQEDEKIININEVRDVRDFHLGDVIDKR